MSVSSAYLNSCSSTQSQERIRAEFRRLARLMNLSCIDDIDWLHFNRAQVIDLLGKPELKHRKASAQNFTLSVIKRLCEEACYAQLLPDSQFVSIKRISNFRGIRCQPPTSLTRDDIEKLLSNCTKDKTNKGTRDAAILAVGLGCGLRRSEIAALQITDINFSINLLRVVGKGNRERYIGLNQNVQHYLRLWLSIRGSSGSSFCFTPLSRGNKIVTTRSLNDETIYLVVRERAFNALGRPISTHDLRRAFASHLLASHVDINTLRLVMGHSDIRTTQIYDRRDEFCRIASIAQIALLPSHF